jgi:hypothetical protein
LPPLPDEAGCTETYALEDSAITGKAVEYRDRTREIMATDWLRLGEKRIAILAGPVELVQ